MKRIDQKKKFTFKAVLLAAMLIALLCLAVIASLMPTGSFDTDVAAEAVSRVYNSDEPSLPMVTLSVIDNGIGKEKVKISVEASTYVNNVTVYFRTLNGTAINGKDYESIDESRQIPSGGSIEIDVERKTTTEAYFTYNGSPDADTIAKYNMVSCGESQYYISKYFYFELFRVENGELSGETRVKLNATKSEGFAISINSSSPESGYSAATIEERSYLLPLPEKELEPKGSMTSSVVSLNNSSLQYYESIGGKLLYNLTGKTGRDSILGESCVPATTDGGFRLDVYRNEGTLATTKTVEGFIHHKNQPYASDADDPEKSNNVLFDLGKGSFYNGKENITQLYGYDKVIRSATGRSYFEYFDDTPYNYTPHNLLVYFEKYQGYSWYSDYVWDCIISTTITDNVAPTVIGYYTTDTIYTVGSTIILSVEFSEPVRIADKNLMPTFDASFSKDGLYNARTFKYVSGEGTNVLQFAYTLKEGENYNFSSLDLSGAKNIASITDMSYNHIKGRSNNVAYANWSTWQYNPIYFSDTSTYKKELQVDVNCLAPKVTLTNKPNLDKTQKSCTFEYELDNISDGTKFQYCFNTNESEYNINDLSVATIVNGKVILNISGLDGKRYLHVVVTNANGLVNEPSPCPIYFDNTSPTATFAADISGYRASQNVILSVDEMFVKDDKDKTKDKSSGFGKTEIIVKVPLGEVDKTYSFDVSQLTSEGDLTKESDDGITVILNAVESLMAEDEGTEIGKRRLYSITLDDGMWASFPVVDVYGVPILDGDGMVQYQEEYFLDNYFGKIYVSAKVGDGLGNAKTYERSSSILMDTRDNVFADMDITVNGDRFGSKFVTPFTFDSAFYYSESNNLTFNYIGAPVYIYSFKVNGEELIIRDPGATEIDEFGDYHPTGETALYDRYATYATKTDGGGGKTNVEFIFNDVAVAAGKTVKGGYYDIELKQVSSIKTQHVTFYVSNDTIGSASNSEYGLTENIATIDAYKLINSIYWVTTRDYMFRTYNKDDEMTEGTGFNAAEGITEQVYFIAKGKPLVYATYQAALDDMVSRERKDIKAYAVTADNVDSINNDTTRNVDGFRFRVGDTVYLYKSKNYRENDPYYYYSGTEGKNIKDALEANAIRTIGKSENGRQTNAFRPSSAEGLGFDLEQIIEVDGYTIFNNNVKSYEYGACPIASSIVIQDYASKTGVATQVYYRKMGAGTSFTNFDITREGVTLKSVLSTTGFYEIVEFSGKGASYRRVYIDCEVPILAADMYKGALPIDKTTFTNYDNGQDFYLTRLNMLGVSDSDDNTLVVIYKNTGISEELLAIYQLTDINNSNRIILADNQNYAIYVYDRSNNSIKLNVRIKSSSIVLTQTNQISKGTYSIAISNRNSNDIVSSDLLYNGKLTSGVTFDNDNRSYNMTIVLNESGNYEWTVKDRYGYMETISFNYTKPDPEGDFFKYDYGTGKWVSIMNTDDMIYDEATGVYTIRARGDLQFRYDNPNYLVTFYQLDLTTIKMSEMSNGMLDTSRTYVYEIPSAQTSWSVRLGYKNDSQVFSKFVCAMDNTPPEVTAEVYLGGKGEDEIWNTVYTNAVANTERIKVLWSDAETGVVKITVGKVGERPNVYTDMEKYADGFELSEEGAYVVTAYDLLGNSTEFFITIDKHVDIDVQTNGKEAAYTDMVYSNGNYYIYIGEALTFEFGDLNIKINKSSVRYYAINDEENEIVTKAIAMTAEEQADEKVLFVENDIVNDEYKHIRYGIDKEGRVYLVLVCPDKLANNDWNVDKIKTFTYDFVVYDSLGYCEIQRETEDEAEYSGEMKIGGRKYGYNMSASNALSIKCELSNNKYTPGFVSDTNDALNDVKSMKLARFNVNFRLNSSEVARLVNAGDIVNISFCFSSTGLSGDESYVELYPMGSTSLVFVENGEYCFRFESKYGTVFSQKIRLGKSIGAITVATYSDDTTREIQIGEFVGDNKQYVYSNKKIDISLNTEYASMVILHNGEDYTANVKVEKGDDGLPVFTLSTHGEYTITVTDLQGNVLVIYAGIKKVNAVDMGIDLHNELNNWNEDALGYDRYSTNKPLGFKLADDSVYYIEYTYYTFENYAQKTEGQTVSTEGQHTIVVYNKYINDVINISSTEKLGSLGNGVYEITMCDKYGNKCLEAVRINNVSNVVFAKRMMDEQGYTEVPHATVNGVGLQSNFGVSISFIEGERYRLTVDDVVVEDDKAYVKTITSDKLELATNSVTIIDEYGNRFSFSAIIDRQRPNLTFVDDDIFTLINNVLTTNKKPAILCDKEGASITYTLNDSDPKNYNEGDFFVEDGYYVVTATDYAGNVGVKTFAVDTMVRYRAKSGSSLDSTVLPQRIIINSGTMSFVGIEETVNVISAKRNGSDCEINSSQSFSEDGFYEVVISDAIGNTDTFAFYIYKNATQKFLYEIPDGYTVLSLVLIEGEQEVSARHLITLSTNGKEQISCPDNANIRFVLEPIDNIDGSNRFTILISSDIVKPYLELTNAANGEETRKDVTFANVSEDCAFYLYKDGELIKEINLKKGQSPDVTVSEEGDYKVVIVDYSGNTQEYTFTRVYTMNVAAIIIIVAVLVLVAVGVVIFLRMRNRMKVK